MFTIYGTKHNRRTIIASSRLGLHTQISLATRGYLMLLSTLGFLFSATAFAAGGSGGGDSPYIAIAPAIVVNYGEPGKIRFLKAEISLRVDDKNIITQVQHHMPLLRHGLVLLFSRQTEADLNSGEGKEALRQNALAELNRLLTEEAGSNTVIKDLYFNNLVIQK